MMTSVLCMSCTREFTWIDMFKVFLFQSSFKVSMRSTRDVRHKINKEWKRWKSNAEDVCYPLRLLLVAKGFAALGAMQKYELKGTINDVYRMIKFLHRFYGFPRDGIRVLAGYILGCWESQGACHSLYTFLHGGVHTHIEA
ncbi:hypothetical protein Droror1_Dr00004491 [Drosera rotundifolia]